MRSRLVGILLFLGVAVTVTSAAALLALGVTAYGSGARPAEADGPAGYNSGSRYRPDNLIRFHVIANSDSDSDQALKRRVRDLVVEYMAPELAGAKSLEEARRIAMENLDEINAVAEKEVRAWGKDYPVRTMLGRFNFPVKSYGNLTLPAGTYEAVRVVIGKGEGANWWCVLFPPLCFVDVSKAISPVDVSPVDVSPVDAGDNAETVPAEDSGENPSGQTADEEPARPLFKIKFKVLELLGW